HPLAQFVDVGQHLLLLFAQSFQAAADLLAFFIGLGLLERILQFLDLFIQILLALGEFLKAIEHLQLLALFGVLLRGGLALGFVFVFVLLQVELFELALVGLLLLGLAAAAIAAAGNLVFARGQLEQCLVG